MRYVEQVWRRGALALLGASTVGCGSLPGTPREAATPAAQVAMPAKADAERAPSLATQRAFDAACQALRAGRTDEAERGFQALAQSNPELGGPHANLGVIYRQAGKLPESMAALEQAVRVSPKQAAYFNQLGITYRQLGKFEQARESYETAITLDPGYAAPILNLGILNDLYLADGGHAMELYDRYLLLSPGGDVAVSKWVVDLKNRKPAQLSALARKEKE